MDYKIENMDYKIFIEQLKQENIFVDAIITDPPYNVSRDHQLWFSNMWRAWMDYGHRDYDFDQREWIRKTVWLLKSWWTIIIFNNWKNLWIIAEELEGLDLIIKDIIRWEKKNPMPRNVNRRYVNDCEFAIWAVKKWKPWTFNKPSNTSYLRPIITTWIVPWWKNRLHPTQKHLEVMEKLVEIHTNPWDIILDPFLWSWTTALDCKNKWRICIGTEIDKKYYDLIIQRLVN